MNYTNSNISEFGGGKRVSFVATNGLQNMGNMNEFGGDDFVCFDGVDMDEYYNLFGLDAKSRERRQKRRDLRVKSKAEARQMKAKGSFQKQLSKRDMAKAQQMSARASEKGVAGDVALANALASDNTSATEEKKGLSMGAKIGIGVGIAVVLGVIGFIIYKKMKK